MLRLNRRSFLLMASFIGAGFVLKNYMLFAAVPGTTTAMTQTQFDNLKMLSDALSKINTSADANYVKHRNAMGANFSAFSDGLARIVNQLTAPAVGYSSSAVVSIPNPSLQLASFKNYLKILWTNSFGQLSSNPDFADAISKAQLLNTDGTLNSTFKTAMRSFLGYVYPNYVVPDIKYTPRSQVGNEAGQAAGRTYIAPKGLAAAPKK